MEIYTTPWFEHWAKKQDLPASALCQAVHEMTQGLYEADLGGGLVKKRVARPGQGKRSGFRTLIATNKGDRWIFVFGFAKNERSNIDKTEETALKKLAGQLLALTPSALNKTVQACELIQVNCNGKEEIRNP